MSAYYDPPEDGTPCNICGKPAYNCECPECPVCGEFGLLRCMEFHGLVVEGITKADVIERLHREQLAAIDEAAEMERLNIEADHITRVAMIDAEARAQEAPDFPVAAADLDDFAYDAQRERMMRRR